MVHCCQGLCISTTKEESTNLGDPLISPIAKDQFKDSVLKYDRYQLKNICSEMNKNPGIWKLSPITVHRARSLTIQKKIRQGHCGGKLTHVFSSNGINKSNLISVMTINFQNGEK